eukprot:3726232-Heterocapsa_arctica.AAC.1
MTCVTDAGASTDTLHVCSQATAPQWPSRDPADLTHSSPRPHPRKGRRLTSSPSSLRASMHPDASERQCHVT